jgi:hypothetical protein
MPLYEEMAASALGGMVADGLTYPGESLVGETVPVHQVS